MGRGKKNISKNEMFARMGITYFKKLAPYKGKIPCNETPFHYIMKIYSVFYFMREYDFSIS
jgi:hypothetical protein